MTTPAYAVAGDLAADPWGLTVPEETAPGLIARASRLIRRATITAVYDARDDGLPVLETLRDAFRDAVCSQVETWVKLSIDPSQGAADGGKVISSKSRGSASVQFSVQASTTEARARAATSLSSDALFILHEAGLAGGSPGTY